MMDDEPDAIPLASAALMAAEERTARAVAAGALLPEHIAARQRQEQYDEARTLAGLRTGVPALTAPVPVAPAHPQVHSDDRITAAEAAARIMADPLGGSVEQRLARASEVALRNPEGVVYTAEAREYDRYAATYGDAMRLRAQAGQR